MAALETTHDWLFGGTLSLRQPARRSGYRVNVDAILLATFAACPGSVRPRPAREAIDLGAGVGAVGLTLLHLGGAARVTMVEIDERLARLAEQNAEENEWRDCVTVLSCDVANASGSADLVICNPPYVAPGRGRAPSERVRAAKYGDLSAFVHAARRVAGRRARVCFVYPAIETTTLFTELRGVGLEPKRMRCVHGRAGDAARVVLVECAPGKAGGLTIEPALFETEGHNVRTAEMNAILTAARSARPSASTSLRNEPRADRARLHTQRAR